MDILFQNTRGALNATARRLARDPVTLEFLADEYDAFQDDGTYSPAAAFTVDAVAFFTGELTADQIQRLAAGGLTVNDGITITLPIQLDRYAQRVYVRGFWYRVIEQVDTEGVTNMTLSKIAAEPGGVYE